MVAGAGSNVTVQVGPNALFVVDTNEAAMSDKILAAIKTISPAAHPIHRQHERRSRIMSAATSGSPSPLAISVNAFYEQGARVYAQDNAYARMTNPKDGSKPLPTALWPTDSFAAALKTLFVTGEPIEMIHQPAAHTDGDLMVFFRKSDVIVAGDVFSTDRYPVIDARRGGTLGGVLDGAEPPDRHRHPGIQLDGRHARHPGARPHRERDRSGRIPRRDDDHRGSDYAVSSSKARRSTR